MAESPSQNWEAHRMVGRAIDSRGQTEENTAQAVTGRPNDTPVREDEPAPLGGNSTFASRAKSRQPARTKAVQEAEDKAVKSSRRKSK